jgi:hypothetical protein
MIIILGNKDRHKDRLLEYYLGSTPIDEAFNLIEEARRLKHVREDEEPSLFNPIQIRIIPKIETLTFPQKQNSVKLEDLVYINVLGPYNEPIPQEKISIAGDPKEAQTIRALLKKESSLSFIQLFLSERLAYLRHLNSGPKFDREYPYFYAQNLFPSFFPPERFKVYC